MEEEEVFEKNPLGISKGIMFGVLFGAVIWGVIIGGVRLVMK